MARLYREAVGTQVVNPITNWGPHQSQAELLNRWDPAGEFRSGWIKRGLLPILKSEVERGQSTIVDTAEGLIRRVNVTAVNIAYSHQTRGLLVLEESRRILPDGSIQHRKLRHVPEKIDNGEEPDHAASRALIDLGIDTTTGRFVGRILPMYVEPGSQNIRHARAAQPVLLSQVKDYSENSGTIKPVVLTNRTSVRHSSFSFAPLPAETNTYWYSVLIDDQDYHKDGYVIDQNGIRTEYVWKKSREHEKVETSDPRVVSEWIKTRVIKATNGLQVTGEQSEINHNGNGATHLRRKPKDTITPIESAIETIGGDLALVIAIVGALHIPPKEAVHLVKEWEETRGRIFTIPSEIKPIDSENHAQMTEAQELSSLDQRELLQYSLWENNVVQPYGSYTTSLFSLDHANAYNVTQEEFQGILQSISVLNQDEIRTQHVTRFDLRNADAIVENRSTTYTFVSQDDANHFLRIDTGRLQDEITHATHGLFAFLQNKGVLDHVASQVSAQPQPTSAETIYAQLTEINNTVLSLIVPDKPHYTVDIIKPGDVDVQTVGILTNLNIVAEILRGRLATNGKIPGTMPSIRFAEGGNGHFSEVRFMERVINASMEGFVPVKTIVASDYVTYIDKRGNQLTITEHGFLFQESEKNSKNTTN